MILRAVVCVFLVQVIAACAELGEAPLSDFDESDYWDSGLVYHRYIDVATLSSSFSSQELVLSGFVSAVAASANDLYFIDEGAGQLHARPVYRYRWQCLCDRSCKRSPARV
jgi:hypothetical protein